MDSIGGRELKKLKTAAVNKDGTNNSSHASGCHLVIKPRVNTWLSAGEVYTEPNSECAYFYCEPASLSQDPNKVDPTLRKFATGQSVPPYFTYSLSPRFSVQ